MKAASLALVLLLIASVVPRTAADCTYSQWGDWTSCTDSCQNLQPGATAGLQQRWRQVVSQDGLDSCADKFQTRSCSCDVATGFVLPAAVGSITTLLLLMCCTCACCFVFSPKARARRAVRPADALYRAPVPTTSAFAQTAADLWFPNGGVEPPKPEDAWSNGTPLYDPGEADWREAWEAYHRRDEQDQPCAICCESLSCRLQVLLSCSHVFHRACIADAERRHGPHSCPLCRTPHYGKRVLYDGAEARRHISARRIQQAWRRHRSAQRTTLPLCLVSVHDSLESLAPRS